MTELVFFAIGSAKSKWSTAPWWRSGLTTLLVGAVAAALAYVAGVLLKNLLT
jgi:VIT1/CCC1 family predicted Fe2+/Mn2+ transporter